jgi:uncharacterized damage-inducible protein DinB
MNLVKLAEYNLWANNRTRERLATLTEEELSKDILPPYGCMRNLVIHIISAIEYNKVNVVEAGKIKGDQLHELLWKMSSEELFTHWSEMDQWLIKFASSNLDLKAIFPNFLGKGEIVVSHADYFTQYLIHTVHHRAQVMSALRLMKKEAIGTDYLFYLSSEANID